MPPMLPPPDQPREHRARELHRSAEIHASPPARAGFSPEQAALSDGYNDLAGREEGTRAGLDNLDAELKREPGRA